MSKATEIWKLIGPVVGKKIPMFNQTIGQFSSSKTNFVGIGMIVAGVAMLYINIDDPIGMLLFTNGMAAIAGKDAITKRN